MNQISFYDGTQRLVIDKPIRLIELFAGYGSQEFALEYLGKNVESWKICEWAVKSIQAYKDAHFSQDTTDYSKDLSTDEIIDYLYKRGISQDYNSPMTLEQIKRLGEKTREIYNNIKATHNLVNIQQTKGEDLEISDTDKYCYIMTYSFPCQDLSSAGLGKGMAKGSGTRSGMLWEVERILDECKELPQVLLMENVPAVMGSKNMPHFSKWLEKLDNLGYSSYYSILNAKDYGVPQNRKRCFMISILGNYYFDFPQKVTLKDRLDDLLEKHVDEKFYLSNKAVNGTPLVIEGARGCLIQPKDRKYKLSGNKREEHVEFMNENVSYALRTGGQALVLDDNVRIRKYTPKECFRLMGVKDEDFDRIAKNQSNASLYHLAGDSIVVNVLMAIFRNMF